MSGKSKRDAFSTISHVKSVAVIAGTCGVQIHASCPGRHFSLYKDVEDLMSKTNPDMTK